MNAPKPITLTPDQRAECLHILEAKGVAPYVRQRALILLLADRREGERVPSNDMIAWWADVDSRTVTRVRSCFNSSGFATALHGEAPGHLVSRKLTRDQELTLLSLLDTSPPLGYPRWTVRTLADAASDIDGMPEISRELVRRLLKRHGSENGGVSAADGRSASSR